MYIMTHPKFSFSSSDACCTHTRAQRSLTHTLATTSSPIFPHTSTPNPDHTCLPHTHGATHPHSTLTTATLPTPTEPHPHPKNPILRLSLTDQAEIINGFNRNGEAKRYSFIFLIPFLHSVCKATSISILQERKKIIEKCRIKTSSPSLPAPKRKPALPLPFPLLNLYSCLHISSLFPFAS